MDNKNITIIGGTGNLGAPVVKNLSSFGYSIKIVARNTEKAEKIFNGIANIEIIKADLKDVESLKTALKATEYLYLSLSTTTIEKNIPFAEEREGVANILEAIDKQVIKQILVISGLGAFENIHSSSDFEFIPNIIRKEGHKYIKNSGIPYTILHCSNFLDNFVFYQRKGTYSIIGSPENSSYFTNCFDYSVHLKNAIGNPEAMHREFPVQGKEGPTYSEAAKRFLSIYDASVKIKPFPKPILNFLSLFVKELKLVKHLGDYFNSIKEEFIAEENNLFKVLGEPSTGIEAYAEKLKQENFYEYLK